MNAIIKFYNNEKSYGVIVKDDIDYFFHKSDIQNTPEKIYKNDRIVSFDAISKPKGPAAKNIVFEEKIKCPVCGWINTKNDENCSNYHCKFTLKYVKGLYASISDEELKIYTEKLKAAKQSFTNSKKKKVSKQQVNKTLDGKIALIKNIKKNDTKLKINNETILTKNIVSYALNINKIKTNGYEECRSCGGLGICDICIGAGERVLDYDGYRDGNGLISLELERCYACNGTGKCSVCSGLKEKYVGIKFKQYKYFINLKFSNAKNRNIYIGFWNNEQEKKSNKVYFYGKKIIDRLNDLC